MLKITNLLTRYSILYIVFASVLWGCMGTFINILTDMGFTSMQLIVFRTLITSLLLSLYILIKGKSLFKIPLRKLPYIIVSSIVTVVVFNYAYISSIQYNGMSVASVLLYTSPMFVVVISVFLFKEKLTPVKVITMFTTILGCMLVSGIFSNVSNITFIGIILGLVSGITYGLYGIMSSIAMRDINPIVYVNYILLIAGIIMLPFADIPASITICVSSWHTVPLLILFALVTELIPYVLFTTGMKYVSASKASISATMEPIVACILGICVWHESFTIITIIGMILSLASAVCLNVLDTNK